MTYITSRYLEPFRRGTRLRQTDGRTDGIAIAVAAYRRAPTWYSRQKISKPSCQNYKKIISGNREEATAVNTGRNELKWRVVKTCCRCSRLRSHGRTMQSRRSCSGWHSSSPVIRIDTPTPQDCEQLLHCVVSILHVVWSVAGDSLSINSIKETQISNNKQLASQISK